MKISLIIYLILLIAGVIKWKKDNDKRYFWYLFPVGGLLIISISKYAVDNYFQLTSSHRAIEFFIFTGLSVIGFIALLVITLKKDFK